MPNWVLGNHVASCFVSWGSFNQPANIWSTCSKCCAKTWKETSHAPCPQAACSLVGETGKQIISPQRIVEGYGRTGHPEERKASSLGVFCVLPPMNGGTGQRLSQSLCTYLCPPRVCMLHKGNDLCPFVHYTVPSTSENV